MASGSTRLCILFVAVVSTLLSTGSCFAEGSSSGFGEGGHIPEFLAIVQQHNQSGEPFRIEGACKSACTMFLGIRNVCVDRGAVPMFHAGHDIKENATGPNTRASRAMLSQYNAALRGYLSDGQYMDSDVFHNLSGSELLTRHTNTYL